MAVDEGPFVRRTGIFSTAITYDLSSPARSIQFDAEGLVEHVSKHYEGRIRIGVDRATVESVLGSPTHRIPANDKAFHYSEPGGDGRFCGRVVMFSENDQVVDIVKYEFYD